MPEIQSDRPRMGLTTLMRTPEFADLTGSQKVFVARLISLGIASGKYNATSAADFAYKTRFPASMGSQLLRQKKIRRVMDLHFGRSGLESILADLQAAAAKSKKAGLLTRRVVRLLGVFEKYTQQESR